MGYRQKVHEKLISTEQGRSRAEKYLQEVADAFDQGGNASVSKLLATQMGKFELDFNAKLKLLKAKL